MASERSKPTKGSRLVRWARRLAVALLSIELVYLVAIHVFLWTPLFAKVVDADPIVLDVHYRRAWSLWPGHVHAEGLSIRGTDSHVEWILKLDRVDFDVSILDAPRPEFHVTRARGDGITLRLRFKIAVPASTDGLLAQTPPIDGLGEDALLSEDPEYPGTWDDAQWKLVTIHLEDVVADHVREIWIDEGHYVGDARITGGFYLKPIRAAEVGPAHVELREGTATLATRMVFQGIRGTADFKLDRFDPRPITGDELLHRISLSTELRGSIANIGSLPVGDGSTTFYGRADVRRCALRVDHGVLADGAQVDLEAQDAIAVAGDHVLVGEIGARAEVDAGRVALRVEGRDLDGDDLAWAPVVRATGDSAQRDLSRALEDLHAIVDVPRLDVSDLARASRVARLGGVRVARGVATIAAKGEAWLDEGRASGTARVAIGDADVRAGDVRVQGDAVLDARVGSARWHTEGPRHVAIALGDAGLDVRADRATASWRDLAVAAGLTARARASAIDVDAKRVALDEARAEATGIELRRGGIRAVTIARATVDASSPRFRADDPLARLRVAASVDRAAFPDVELLDALLPHGTKIALASRPGASLSAQAGVDVVDHVADGSVLLRARGLGAASDDAHATADADVVASAKIDLARRVLTVHGANVVVTGLAGGFGPPSRIDVAGGRIALRAATAPLDLDHPSLRGVDAHLRIDAVDLRDARALNRLLPSGDVLAIESGTARLSADVATSASDGTGAGRVDVTLANAGVRLHDAHLAGDFAIAGRVQHVDPARSDADVEGSRVAMRGVRVSGGGADARGWTGDLVIQRGALHLASEPSFDGDVTLEAKDARPVLALLLGNGVPSPIVDWIDMPNLAVSTHLRVEPKLLVVSDFFAAGDNLSLRATYVVKDDDASGAVVAIKGPFGAGLRLANDGTHLHLFGLDGWYAEQRDAAMRLACGAPAVGVTETTGACVIVPGR